MVYELSQPNNFWKAEGMWQTFICCAWAVFTLSFWEDVYSDIGENNFTNWNMKASMFNMGN